MGMPSRRTNNFPESGRGLGHVTPTIFGSTVCYPSDSLASCFIGYTIGNCQCIVSDIFLLCYFVNTIRYDTIEESLTWTRKLSIQLNLAHEARN